jgi:HlyD family secretion protein
MQAREYPGPVDERLIRMRSTKDSRSPGKRLVWVAGAGITLIALLILAWVISERGPSVRYVTAPVTQGAVVRAVSATGTVNPVLTIIVGTYVSGVIQQLYCDFNTEVKQGQICAKIDPRPYQSVLDQDQASLDVAKAQLEKDQASLAYADVNYQRNAKLAEHDYASKDTADNAKSVFEQAKAQVALDRATIEQRGAELAAAQINLGYTDIVSPVNGTVVSRNVTMGQTVAATFQTPTLFLIATDLTKMEVDTNVSESDIGAIKEGNSARFTVDSYPNRVFQGTVAQVRQSPQTVQNVVTYDVVVNVDNSDHALMPGMTASVQLITDARSNVMRVPDQTLRYAPAGQPPQDRVWLLRDGKPAPIHVVRGLDDDSNTEILKGDIRPGDALIIGEQRDTAPHAALPTPRM